jgi:two-component system, cell cycle sensor histidine kinase and response regulator CckA
MSLETSAPEADASEEISALIETLVVTEQRLEKLTSGEVDTVAGRDGRTFLLRRAQEELRYSVAAKQAVTLNELRGLFDVIPAMVWFKDTESNILRINRRAAEDIGKSVEELEGKSMYDIYPEDAAKYYSDDLEVINSGKPKLGIIETIRNRADETVWVQTDKVPVCDKDGKVVGIVVMAQDITKGKRADENVQRLAAIVESSADAIISKTLQGIITSWNPAAEKMFGYTAAEIIGQPLLVIVPPDRAGEETDILAGFTKGELVRHFETVRVRKDGSGFEVSVTISPIKDAGGKIIGASKIVRDITELKKLEQQFRQSQKMESFGQLAGGVAHDFNNILAVMKMQLDLFTDDGRLTPEQVDCIKELGVSTERASALTRQLLLFSRKEILQLRDLDLNQSVNGMTNMLRRVLGADIEVQFRFSLQLMAIHADAGMMDQVLLNLAVNSRDAMPKGGQLIIETSAVNFARTAQLPPPLGRPGAFVCLSVSDNGCGIPAANLARIFEPFFTTKPTGRGTGLGLATLFGIVQLHKGWVNVESEVGRGTTFRIYLPRLEKLLTTQQKPEQLKLSSLPGGNETILLVEDDDFLRPSICNTLSRLGYHVIPVSNGVKALEIWQERREQIDMLITDLVMPGGLTGKKLGELLLKQSPKLKVIYASGYSAEIGGADFPLKEGVNFLAKPFLVQKLAQTIRALLDKGAAA